MNRRQFLTAAGGSAAALTTGYLGARVADVRPYNAGEPSPAGDSPAERIVAAARHRYAVDHRVFTDVGVAFDDGGEVDHDAVRYRGVHEHSRRRHLHVFTTLQQPSVPAPPLPGLYFLLHWNYAEDEDAPFTSVIHRTDADIVSSWDAPTPDDEFATPALGDLTLSAFGQRSDDWLIDQILPHQGDWRETDRTSDWVTYRLDDPGEYAAAAPLGIWYTGVNDGSYLEVVLDPNGKLARVVDHRDVQVTFDDGDAVSTGRLVYDIETAFDQYGMAKAPRPDGDVPASVVDRLAGLAADIETY